MVINQREDYKIGYNPICEIGKLHGNMQMDIGVIKLDKDNLYINEENKERAILLIEGKVSLKWLDQKVTVERKSCFDENPICLHIPQNVKVEIRGWGPSELMYQGVKNDNNFKAKLYNQEDTVSDVFGKDTLQNTSIRTVRTIIDDDIAPYSNLVIGEVINHPGKWSSYPPHYHKQPEVYHYRFLPKEGFGLSLIDNEACKVENRSTSLIHSNVVHPQCSAPGYAMYYVWMIPHIKEKRWLKDRTFESKHEWLLDEQAIIWSEK